MPESNFFTIIINIIFIIIDKSLLNRSIATITMDTNNNSKNSINNPIQRSDSVRISSSSSSSITTTISSTTTPNDIPRLVLAITGAWGRWQYQFFIFFLITAVCSCWHSLQLTFIAPTVHYWCTTDSEIIDTRNYTNDQQCEVGDDNVKCNSWYFNVGHNDSFYHRTIISEVWICIAYCKSPSLDLDQYMRIFINELYMFLVSI